MRAFSFSRLSIKTIAIITILGFISVLTSPLAYAAPAKCYVYNTGSDLLNSDDDTSVLVDCAQSEYADLQTFEEDSYYNITINPTSAPSVRELTQEQYEGIAEQLNGNTGSTTTGSNNIDQILTTVINLLSAIAGIALTASMIMAGFQYMTARDNASQVSAAKTRIFVTVCCIVLLAFGYTLLQWLVPGGIFS